MTLEVGDLLDAELFSLVRAHRQGVGVVESPGLQPFDLELLGILLGDDVVDGIPANARLGRCARGRTGLSATARHLWQLHAENGEQAGSGVLDVDINLTGNQRLMNDGGATEVELALDRISGVLKEQRHDLGQDDRLCEVLRSNSHGGKVAVLRGERGNMAAERCHGCACGACYQQLATCNRRHGFLASFDSGSPHYRRLPIPNTLLSADETLFLKEGTGDIDRLDSVLVGLVIHLGHPGIVDPASELVKDVLYFR